MIKKVALSYATSYIYKRDKTMLYIITNLILHLNL